MSPRVSSFLLTECTNGRFIEALAMTLQLRNESKEAAWTLVRIAVLVASCAALGCGGSTPAAHQHAECPKAPGAAAAQPSAQPPVEPPKLWPAGEMKWETDPAIPQVKFVVLWGDPKTGEHGMLRKWPAGFSPPAHTHPFIERFVMLSGTLIARYKGAPEVRLGPGAYSEIPLGVLHAPKCSDEADCVFVLVAPGKFAVQFAPPGSM
jgi:quercetin dioxygenase-like cupin family protein